MMLDKYVRDTNHAMILKMTENTFFKECELKRKEVNKLETKIFKIDQTLFSLKYDNGLDGDSTTVVQVQ
jgi:hypothetical protein